MVRGEMMKKTNFWTTPKGVTFKMYEEILGDPTYYKFLYRKERNKRLRGIMACSVYFGMDIGEECTTEMIRICADKYNPIGNSAISLSSQRVGALLTMMVRYGILSSRKGQRNRAYYRRLI
tara:strand:- start:290 stop:652 length:363 start_codon:yes stop_codon:yes gene_type:complete